MAEPTFDQIEAYLADRLTQTERKAFEQRCQQDEAWAAQVRLHLSARQALTEAGREDLRQKLLAREQPSLTRPLWRKPWFHALAAGLALLLLAFFWRPWASELAPDALFSQYQELPPPSTLRSVQADSLAQRWDTVMQLYQQEAYQEMVPRLQALLRDSSFVRQSGDRGRLYLGVAYLKLAEQDKAIQAWRKISPESLYHDQALWYRALALGQAGRYEEAHRLLTQIKATDGHYRQAEAQEILARWGQ